jgi:8-oxo-dGTP diphosphatase
VIGKTPDAAPEVGGERQEDAKTPREVVGLVLLGSAGLLLEWRPEDAACYPGVWDTPGGKIETNETPWQALVREIDEELGVALLDARLVAVLDDTDPVSGRAFRHHVFTAAKTSAQVTARLGQRLAWIPVGGLAGRSDVNPIVIRSIRCIERRGKAGVP